VSDMAEKLKELLEKINEEGIKRSEAKAHEIEEKAKVEAGRILDNAKRKSRKLIEDANTEIEKTKKSRDIALKQASRDLILSLKEEIKKTLGRVVSKEVSSAISGAELAAILGNVIEKYIEKGGKDSDIKVLLKKETLDKLKTSFISKLNSKLKQGIDFKVSPNINAGFSISFDKGKSFFDFSDDGLKEALSAFLNPELAKLLK
tara:strand:- start:219 stop:830 length:612 start_codon:yes stop_codon:yes gene_type:complete